MAPEGYFEYCPALFWAIASVGARRYQVEPTLLNRLSGPITRLVWSALADMKQMYGVVKALCLLCTWPFPTSSTSSDPTFIFCGVMMQIAMQIGLHRPSHAQDFSKFRMELHEDELKDRVRTWAICNIVAQRVATGYGQPANTLYDWTLSSKAANTDSNFTLPSPVADHLRIERFSQKVSSTLYSNRQNPVGLASDTERQAYVNLLASDFADLEEEISDGSSAVTLMYLRAAHLHLRLSAFFSPPTMTSYRTDLMRLYNATTSFLETCLGHEQSAGSGFTHEASVSAGFVSLIYGTNYIFQMMLAAGFALLKLHNNFLQQVGLDSEQEKARNLFNKTIWALRSMSVQENDLAQRLAEVLAQVWRGSRAAAEKNGIGAAPAYIDNSMQLKVRCRMSVSLVYDSVWRWREEASRKGISLESYLKHPTDPSAITDSSASSVTAGTNNFTSDPPLRPLSVVPGMPGMATGLGFPGNGNLASGYIEANYEVFDPLNWMLDGLVDFPYALPGMPDMDQLGMGGLGGIS
ncbi:hypothetical protein EPUS_07640 [Endocarpon pusillum Z07020]|uniref:Xylanolytic transcriptional activator regulatory domain-containing protein n=1 Tax=Endocarpon pusillum (strain Z07020 / HMAS-L-300199) TaxID=1263415 RepID=U1I0U5_ENDPU|nr:uncharacterized protein EPUS_07640 [Endocarpon pusillum Z07020]ERF76850.1 hypothetical protein EPUS_07640 [Endocarpon pusillum Z07020]